VRKGRKDRSVKSLLEVEKELEEKQQIKKQKRNGHIML
jgi:hypothetical protein